MSRKQAGVNRRHRSKEGDLFVARGFGVVSLFRVEERCSEALPYHVSVEGEEELDGASREKGCENGVYSAMYMVKRKDVKEVI